MLICIYAHVYTHINTQHILSCPPGQFRSLDTNTFKKKSMAKKKKKKQSPIEENRSKKRFTERTSREIQETPHCPREYTFSEQLKRLQRSIQRRTIYQFFHNDCLCRTSWNIPQLYMINQPPHAIMFHSPNIIQLAQDHFQWYHTGVLWHKRAQLLSRMQPI